MEIGTVEAETITLQVYFFLFILAVIMHFPAFFPLTSPFELTVAMFLLLLDHVIFCLVPLSFNVYELPTFILMVFLLIVGVSTDSLHFNVFLPVSYTHLTLPTT